MSAIRTRAHRACRAHRPARLLSGRPVVLPPSVEPDWESFDLIVGGDAGGAGPDAINGGNAASEYTNFVIGGEAA